jgi:hypothetical protein
LIFMAGDPKASSKRDKEIEPRPDGWDAFERTVDKMLHTPPKPREPPKKRPASKGRARKGKARD